MNEDGLTSRDDVPMSGGQQPGTEDNSGSKCQQRLSNFTWQSDKIALSTCHSMRYRAKHDLSVSRNTITMCSREVPGASPYALLRAPLHIHFLSSSQARHSARSNDVPDLALSIDTYFFQTCAKRIVAATALLRSCSNEICLPLPLNQNKQHQIHSQPHNERSRLCCARRA
jgi:hypothetical protein